MVELAMIALLAVGGWRLLDPAWVKAVLGIGLPVVVAVVWGSWMAPNSPRRLPNPLRLFVQSLLFVATAAVCAAAGLRWIGVAFVVVALIVFAVLARTDR